MGAEARRGLSVQALARRRPISDLAARHNVSRKFVYQQAAKAAEALDQAFAPEKPDKAVLFHLPITKNWLRQFVLAQVLIGHTAFRGVGEILDAVFDYPMCPATVHNIVQEAVCRSRAINDAEDLSAISVGAHDEIFQAGQPVLVGADALSTYCYLLAAEEHRDETTWGVHLLDLQQRGLHPDYTIADGGQGIRAGQAAAWGDRVPCHGDVFHGESEMGKLACFLENRACGCITARQGLERKMARAKKRNRGATLSKKLALARQAESKAVELAEDIAILSDWLQKDILSLAGPDLKTRRELLDFVLAEMHQREPLCRHRIRPVRTALENQGDNLLAFAGLLDERFTDIAARFQVPLFLVHALCQLHNGDKTSPLYWQREAELRKKLRGKFRDLRQAVLGAMAETTRASSIIENLNSRLRNYFFLRRHIGKDYLDLLRFFLNHRRFLRSHRPERVGKSPTELLTARRHGHWLELLGFQRFQRN
jgi:hypothetical protein